MRTFFSFGPILLAVTLALTGCDTAEERAEGHYQRGMELLAEGDADRALLEFRNVFKLNGKHTAARQQYAEIMREQGDIREALSHYLRLVEQDPDNVTAHRDLTELALIAQDYETAAIHATRAWELDPGDPTIQALKATIDYRQGDNPGEALEMARSVIAGAPDVVTAHMLLIGDRLKANAPEEALGLIDTALEANPSDEGLHLARLATLEILGDTTGTGAQLQQMATLFPGSDGIREALIQWHLRSGDTDAAEKLLRENAARNPSLAEPALTVVAFLREIRGPAEARAELGRLIETAENPRPFEHALAELDFTEGKSGEAIGRLEDLLEGTEPSDETRNIQVSLARMLLATGATDDGAAVLESILEGDGRSVPALKLRASLAVGDDRPQAAIQDMRTALTQAPQDPEIMTIMALAHERDGSRELMGERLAMAVETSNRGAGESLRYAAFLMQDGRAAPAEAVITDALRRVPEDSDLLNALGQIHLEREDWLRAEQTAGLLLEQGDPVSTAMANALRTESLRRQGRTEDMLALLENLAGTGNDHSALANLIRTQVAAGETEAAREHLATLLTEAPDDLSARLLLAGLEATTGEEKTAEKLYRDLILEIPDLTQPYQALFTLLASQGRTDEAEATLEAGIARARDNGGLLFIQAGLLEARGNVDGAIANYEVLYARDSRDLVVANNLASLLTGTGADQADLDRAFAIARRLRTSDVPYFQDTYGWILHLRGDSGQAYDYLSPAAGVLPDNALVLFHLAETEFALNRREAAEATFRRALAASGTGTPLPPAQISAIEARLAEITAGETDDTAQPGKPTEG